MSASPGRAVTRALGQLVVLACALLLLGGSSARAATVPDGFYGVNSGGAVLANAALRPAAVQAMRAGNLSFVRVDASWDHIEPAPPVAGVHTYVWALHDLFVADLARNGLRWYPMVGYSAPWASSSAGDPFAPPANDADFAAYAAALAGRYGSGGSFWAEHPELPRLPMTHYGIWNEPSNSTFWHGPQATPARYMSLYLAARAAIKAVDPNARVVTAGLLDSGMVDADAYLRAMLDSAGGARNQIDAVGWHPYVGDVSAVLASIRRARTTLGQYGIGGVPIEISEVGWHTGFTATQRADYLRGLAARLPYAGLNVTRLMPYVWSGDPQWQITDADGSTGQLGNAYFAGIRDALGPQAGGASSTKKKAACKTKTKKKKLKSGKAAKAKQRCASTKRSKRAKSAKSAKSAKKSKRAKK
jgi:hypothetical protein